MYYVLSVLLGLIPEVLFFTLFITYTKNIKQKRIKLFFLVSIAYFLCILVQEYQTLYYILWGICIYISCKILYKNKIQIIDIFIISVAYAWNLILSFVFMNFAKKDLSNYVLIYTIERVILFLPFIFKNKFNVLYKKYCKLWNRNDNEKRLIKSITLRNISLILLNIFILGMDIIFINISNFLK